MIYIFMALYAEAKPFIEELHLRKVNSGCKFVQYISDDNADMDICLTITGSGSIAASTAVGAVCTCGELTASDMMINIGTAAGDVAVIGEIFLIHKITELATGRTFYPDMLYRHSFAEAEIFTAPTVIQKLQDKSVLFDMEAAAIYQAGNFFVGPHQLQFIKIVSDAGNEQGVTSEQLSACVSQSVDRVVAYIRELDEISRRQKTKNEVFSQTEMIWIERLCEDLHCSETMRAMVEQLCRYWKLAGVDYIAHISKKYSEGRLCKNKREGKRLIDEWKRELL